MIDNKVGDHQIEFQPIGRRGLCPAGETLLNCARRLGVELASLCGGLALANANNDLRDFIAWCLEGNPDYPYGVTPGG